MSHQIALVSCVKSKRGSPTAARDLYTSQLFRALRGYAEATSDAWYILSAEHGLLHPDQIIAPYERTLNTMGKQDRRAWAERVQEQLAALLPPDAEITVLAGTRYREDIVPFLQARGHSVRIPLEGLRFGKQLARLNQLAANGYPTI